MSGSVNTVMELAWLLTARGLPGAHGEGLACRKKESSHLKVVIVGRARVARDHRREDPPRRAVAVDRFVPSGAQSRPAFVPGNCRISQLLLVVESALGRGSHVTIVTIIAASVSALLTARWVPGAQGEGRT